MIELRLLPDLLAGVGMLALVALLLYVAPTSRVHRAFALFIVVTAMNGLMFVVRESQTVPSEAESFERITNYYRVASPFAAAFFGLRFLDAAGRSGRLRAGTIALLVGSIAALAGLAADHTLFHDGSPDGAGPLFLIWGLQYAVLAVLAWAFTLAADRADAGSRRQGLLLAATAFAILPALWSLYHVPNAVVGTPTQVGPWGSASLWARSVSLVPLIAMLVSAVRSPRFDADPDARRLRGRLLVVVPVTAAIGLAAGVLHVVEPRGWVISTLDGVGRLAIPLLVTSALLRHSLFDVDVKLRFAISKSTIAALFIAVFFVASETAQQFLGDTLGSTYVGIAAAGALVFAMAPLQRAAERLAERAVPIAEPGAATPGPTRREDAYRDALRIALKDRRLTRDEEIRLHRIADELGITASRAHAILVEVEHEVNG